MTLLHPKVLHIITRLDTGGSATNTIASVDLLRKHGFQTALAYGRMIFLFALSTLYSLLSTRHEMCYTSASISAVARVLA